MTEQTIVPVETISATIFTLRDQRVILDSDLARLYGVTTKRLNEQVKRNIDRFPADFLYQLTEEEFEECLRSQIATSNVGRGGRRYLPYAFTEHGALMAATILNSPTAVEVSLYVVRAFIQQRAMLATHSELALRLERLERRLQDSFAYQEDRLDDHENQLEQIIETLQHVRSSLTERSTSPQRAIGFRTGNE
ncbi:MAG: ORF6N domain protein [bacterium ADurb.Bin429]|nr:MAG: ORF6N domain protein [bacterium ADurb.Bin429]